jgi:plastocyanin
VAGARSQLLKVANFAYSPPSLTVDAGTTVAITNEDDSPHTVTSKQSGAFDSGTIDGGKRGKVTFSQPGTYAYFCAFHPFMNGTVTVE